MRKTLLVVGSLFAAMSLGAAAEAAKPAMSVAAAFDRLKSLAGQWEAQVNGGKAQLIYEVVAGGSAVVERDIMDGAPPMLTVYYLDGNRLLLTHYCMAGNQPRMEARSYNADTGELRFDFLDATNLANPNAGHMHNAKMRLIDNDHLSSEWQFYENGKPKFTETAQYARIHQ